MVRRRRQVPTAQAVPTTSLSTASAAGEREFEWCRAPPLDGSAALPAAAEAEAEAAAY